MNYEINYGKRQFLVDVVQKNRKQFSISVHPDLKISAKAPADLNNDSINRQLIKRAPWIARQFDFFEQYQPPQPERKYVSGETHYYLGRQYRLKNRSAEISQVRLKGKYFLVELPELNNNLKVKNLIQKWYTQHAKKILEKRVLMHLPVFIKLGVTEPKILFRRMQKRWGSCTIKKNIVLNTELVKAPIHCIDYVVIHELCHLLYPKHDSRFFRLLNHIIPDWIERKDRLERTII